MDSLPCPRPALPPTPLPLKGTNMSRPLVACATIVMLTACTQEPGMAPPPVTPPVENACGAADLQNLVGRDASVLETMRFGQPIRIITPGMAVTMDFSPERLNILVNDAEKIESVTCG